MKEMKFCEICHQHFSESDRPFFPVGSGSAFHWKCYIQRIKEEKEPIYMMDEYEVCQVEF